MNPTPPPPIDPPTAAASSAKTQSTEDGLLIRRIHQTEAEVKRVDFFSTVAALLTLALAALLFGVTLDHLLPHGLSPCGRTLFFCAAFAALAAYFTRRVLPLVKYRINPLYAADILEHTRPTLKNSLINWLSLWLAQPAEPLDGTLVAHIRRGLTVQTAQKVSEIPKNEIIVDHTPVIRWGIALTILVALFAAYSILSAKSPFVSAVRLMLPFASIEPPQSVRFVSIEPGDAAFYQGAKTLVRADISGVKGDSIWFSYTTADRRFVDQLVAMKAVGANLYELEFPPDEIGLTETLDYRITVGDPQNFRGRSAEYRLEVRPAMTFVVESAAYHYPDYTGLKNEERASQGNVRALAGTRIDLTARSNISMEKALFIPDFQVQRAEMMTISPQDRSKATHVFTLRTKSNGTEQTPEFVTYQLLCTDADGIANIADPSRSDNGANLWRVEIVDDRPPTIKWVDVPEEEIRLRPDERFTVTVRAADSDFALRRVRLFFERRTLDQDVRDSIRFRQAAVAPRELLQPIVESGPPPHTGEIVLTHNFSPRELGLEAGDEVEFYATAFDSRLPNPNLTSTDKRLLIVLKSDQSDTEKNNKEKENQNDSSDSSGENESGDSSDPSEQQSGEQETSESESASNEQGQSEESVGNEEKSNGEKNDDSSQDPQKQNPSPSGEPSAEPQSSDGNAQDAETDNSQSGSGENTPSEPQKSDNSPPSENGGANNASNGESAESSPQNQEPSNGESNGESNSKSNGSPPQNQEPSNGESQPNKPSDHSKEESPKNASDSNGPNEQTDTPTEANPSEKKEPIDPQTNPGDAFEEILKHCCPDGLCDQTDSSAGISSANSGEGKPSDDKVNANELQNSSGSIPENASRPSEGAPPEIPQNAERTQGQVDPASNNFMTTDQPANESNGTQVSPDANITNDPDHPTGGTPTSPDANAQELSGGSSNGSNEGAIPSSEQNSGSNDGDPSPSEPNGQRPPEGAEGSGGSGNTGDTPRSNDGDRLGGNGSAGDAPNKPSEKPSQKNQGEGDRPNQNGENPSGPQGSGGAAAGELTDSEPAAEADRAHLKYTEAATALVLEYLEDQLKNGPDPKLLDDLGWTEEQMRQFWNQWNDWKKAADQLPNNSPDKTEYLDNLRNLGIRPPRPSGELSAEHRSDEFRAPSGERQSLRSEPPAGFEERFRAYHEGISHPKR